MKDLTRIPICKHGRIENISIDLLSVLGKIELRLGYKLDYVSGYRCPACNEEAGGSPLSAHQTGEAVDIRVNGSRERYLLVQACFEVGVRRLGIGKTRFHLDVRSELDQDVIWVY